MASVNVPGNGTITIDTFTPAAGLHRQATVISSHSNAANAADVITTVPGAASAGLVVRALAGELIKGTQGPGGFSTQDLKDSGRTLKLFSATFTAATAEALVSLTPITGGTAGTAATSFAVSASKTLRVIGMSVSTRNAAAAAQGVVCQLRMTATGAVTATSPLIGSCAAGTGIATANASNSNQITLPDAIELSGTMQFGVSQIGSATANNTVVVYAYEY